MAQDNIHSNNKVEATRISGNFSPSLWTDRFSSIPVTDDETKDKWLKEVEELKAEIRCRITKQSTSTKEKLGLIDMLERVGISYHFKEEIEKELYNLFNSRHPHDAPATAKEDLTVASLYFRLLREHGFRVSSQMFDGFKDEDGFKNIIGTDVKGLLNLYEASYTMIHGEVILQEALEFTSTHLKLMIPHLPPSLAKLCVHTLEHPFHRCVPRSEARFFISLYEEEKHPQNDLVLRLAKLDNNLLQILHRKEMAEISSWWKELNEEHTYARDRMVELYFWAMGVHFEPQYSLARVMLAKFFCLFTLIDDAYDAYGTLKELKVFTEAVERWDTAEINRLPEYMKSLYKAILEFHVPFEKELQTLGRSSFVSHVKQRMIENAQCFYIEARWFMEGHTPTFDEYLKNGMFTTTFFTATAATLLGMESATNQVFEQWLKSNPKILKQSATICRLTNDLANYESDKKKGQITTGTDCYMEQYGVTKEEAQVELHKMVENAWKDLNEEFLKPTAAPDDILTGVINLGRLAEATYKHKRDGLNNPEKVLKPRILAMLVDAYEI